VQLLKYWSDMTKLRRTVNEPSTSVQYMLEFLYLAFWNSVQEAITIVQSAHDQGMNQLLSMLLWKVMWQIFPDVTNIVEIVERTAAGLRYMSGHVHVGVKPSSKVPCRRHRCNISITNLDAVDGHFSLLQTTANQYKLLLAII
jgi:hypothetical protein